MIERLWEGAAIVVIGKTDLDDLEKRLEAAEEMRHTAEVAAGVYKNSDASLRTRLEAAEDLVREVARSGVEFEDPRVRHVTVQIDVDTWRGCVAALAGK